VICNLCKILLELGLRILMSHQEEKSLFSSALDLAMGLRMMEIGRQGTQGCRLFRVYRLWISQLALFDAMYLGCMHLLKPVKAGQATVNCCFW